MSQVKARAAYRTKILQLPSVIDQTLGIAWERKTYNPVVEQPYLRETFRAVGRSPQTVGDNPLVIETWLLLLDVFSAAGTEPSFYEAISDEILGVFAPHGSLIYDGLEILISRSEPSGEIQPDPTGAWAFLPLEIEGWSHAFA